MLKCYNYDIVCQEIPQEISLAVNISGCPIHCKGCHSQWLWEDVGEELTDGLLESIIDTYGRAITCVLFMGGDNDYIETMRLAGVVREKFPHLKTAWYSGRTEIPEGVVQSGRYDFIKIGPYIEELGGLKSKTTNQKLYHITPKGEMELVDFLSVFER